MLFVYDSLRRWWNDRTLRRELLCAVIVISATTLAIVLPRYLLTVARSYQEIDPLNNPDSLRKLVSIPLNMKRDLNLLLAVCGYGLPCS